MYKSGERNETHLDLFGFGASCDKVVPLAEFEVEILVLEELATGGFLVGALDLDFCGLMSSCSINESSSSSVCCGETIS
jgi:hypothetical protein